MASLMAADPLSHHGGGYEGENYRGSQERPDESGGRWYFSRKEIEENSPSRRDGIDLKKETYLRKSYCTFLQDLGMRLKVPQVTIATAIIFCHRFFLRQSHSKNDRRTIATVCMFLAGKVEETPRPLKDVILVSYEIIHKKDPAAVQRIKQKEVYENQKEQILTGERIVLATLGFDLNVHHPYKPLVEAIKKFKVAQNALAQVAWNFVNDGLRTSLCLQFKPHHIAAGAIFLAAKFLKVKLPSDGEKVWWQEFDVTPRQLEEVSNQMLELYEQNRVPPSQASEAEGSGGGNQRPTGKASAATEEHNINSPGVGANSNAGTSNPASSRAPQNSNDYGSAENNFSDRSEINDRQKHEVEPEAQSRPRYAEDDQKGESNDKYRSRALECHKSPQEVKKIDKAVENKVKAALEKRRKAQGDVMRKTDVIDDDDLIERELEDGIELPAGNRKHDHPKHQDDDFDYVEEGELEPYDEAYRSPKSNSKKRKASSSPSNNHSYHDFPDDRNRSGRHDYSERDHKRHLQGNHA